MNRRHFLKAGVAAGAGAVASPGWAGAFEMYPSGFDQGSMWLPASPDFKTRHVVLVILGNGARRKDVLHDPTMAPALRRLMAEGTVFSDDYGETATLHGPMVSELLTGHPAPEQRPTFPTWQEMVRKHHASGPLDSFILQSQSYFGGFSWDVKNYSRHPDYGARYGATSLTMNNVFGGVSPIPADTFLDRHAHPRLGFSRRDIDTMADWYHDIVHRQAYRPASPRGLSTVERATQIGDAMALSLAPEILQAFRPRCLTVQIVGLEDAHDEAGSADHETGFAVYRRHLGAMDALIGRLWDAIQEDASLRDRTALIIRPDCGRHDHVDRRGQLSHSLGDPESHSTFCLALGPDVRRGEVVSHRVQRRDIAPTMTYLLTGSRAPFATGHVRTQMFAATLGLPDYRLPETRPVPPRAAG